MSHASSIIGIVGEKPRLPPLGEYNGEDVFSPVLPDRGQIDEMLLQVSGRLVMIIAVAPGQFDTPESIAQEFYDCAKWHMEWRSEEEREAANDKLELLAKREGE